MADLEKAQLAQVMKLFVLHRELMEKLKAVASEMDDILEGKAWLGQRIKLFEDRYKATWATRYHGEYLFTQPRDRAALKRLLKALTDEELYTRVWNYVKNDDPFYVKARHSFPLFVAAINSLASPLPQEEPRECDHTPVCRNRWSCYQLRDAEKSGDAVSIDTARRRAAQ